MRGRQLIREAQNPSICAFCAHRMGATRAPSHVQRRFLQSSKPLSKPPGEATAADSKPAGSGGWGSSFGSSSTAAKPASGGGGGWGSTFGAKKASDAADSIEDLLTPEERRTRELMKQRQEEEKKEAERRAQEVMPDYQIGQIRRPGVRVRGSGPEATREGRPLPSGKPQVPVRKHEVADSRFQAQQAAISRRQQAAEARNRGNETRGRGHRVIDLGGSSQSNEARGGQPVGSTGGLGSLGQGNVASVQDGRQQAAQPPAGDSAAQRKTPFSSSDGLRGLGQGNVRGAQDRPQQATEPSAGDIAAQARTPLSGSDGFGGSNQIGSGLGQPQATDAQVSENKAPERGAAGGWGGWGNFSAARKDDDEWDKFEQAALAKERARRALDSSGGLDASNQENGGWGQLKRRTQEQRQDVAPQQKEEPAQMPANPTERQGFVGLSNHPNRRTTPLFRHTPLDGPSPIEARSDRGLIIKRIERTFVDPPKEETPREQAMGRSAGQGGYGDVARPPPTPTWRAPTRANMSRSIFAPMKNPPTIEAGDEAYERYEENVKALAARFGTDETGVKPPPVEQTAVRADLVSSQPISASQKFEIRPTKRFERKAKEDEEEIIEEIEVPVRGRRGRSSRLESNEDSFRGRDRDKLKRRGLFRRTDEEEEENDEALARAERKRARKAAKAAKTAAKPTPILLPEYVSVSNLATALKVRLEDFLVKMEELGFEGTSSDHILNSENAGLIAQEYNFEPLVDRGATDDLKAQPAPEDVSSLPPRPPVVTIMGHVDHGKTTILDWLRKSSVAAGEHGGITQHIGAFSVPMPSGKIITFLDTPGHAAFLSMRQRGANVTDIVILVVAADDSVKPQTIEAINHAKSAKVPIIVAINKIDKEEADIDRVKQDLARHNVEIEDYGGDTQVVCVSGKTGQGMESLEEAAVTLSEILDMRAPVDGPAEGWVIEASIKSAGKVATVLVRRGTMRPGDYVVAGQTWGRIRVLRNEAGVAIDSAGPGTPVQVDGWREQPAAGDEVLQAPDEAKAKTVIEYRHEKKERDRLAEDMEAINLFRREEHDKREAEKKEAEALEAGEEASAKTDEAEHGPKHVPFIIKADVSGSVEAVVDSISSLGNSEVRAQILRAGVGQIAEFDVEHAAAAKGHIINFNTAVNPSVQRMADFLGVKILDHNIIYRLVDEVRAKLSEELPPLVSSRVLGEAEVAEIFRITIKGRQTKPVAGCRVKNGVVGKNERVRVLRDGEKVFDGNLDSLKQVKKDVMEMKKGQECGMGFDGWDDFQVGDQIQSYQEIREKRYL